MGMLVLGILILAMAGHSSAAFCVCKQGVSDSIMQKAIDYACGAGADCNPIRPTGQCYNPATVLNHCSYAVNSYYQRKASTGATCAFNGVAILTNTNPSFGSCSYSAFSGVTGTNVPTMSPGNGATPTTTPLTPVVSGTGAGVTPTTSNTSPYTTAPGGTANGVLGGMGTGLPPTGSSMDENGVNKLGGTSLVLIHMAFVVSSIMCFWN